MAGIDDVLATATRRSETVALCLRGDLAKQHDDLVDELERLTSTNASDEETSAVAEQIAAVEADVHAATVEFVVAGMGRLAWSNLLAAHAPQPEHIATYGFRLRWNPETFPAAAIAASIVTPEDVTEDHVRRLEEIATEAEWEALWGAVLTVNLEGRRPGESRAASAILRRMRPSSEPPDPSESPAASSSDAA